ncbi:hypothetical protein [Myxosarcina sp. GI1]|uniref:hypothetical protein n=1 Tax=Myxosarcina sp. GI1 TaxID=1541065 RepID=UPI0012E01772|nr:hypothetical protein [Myxosarcina sp. GI1]
MTGDDWFLSTEYILPNKSNFNDLILPREDKAGDRQNPTFSKDGIVNVCFANCV